MHRRMSSKSRKFDDEDDWGVPKYPRQPPLSAAANLRLQFRQYRLPVLIIAAILSLIYWWRYLGRQKDPTDWSRFAYVQYATDAHTMCNAFMIFEALKRLGSKAERVLLYPETWNAQIADPHDRNSQLLVDAKKKFGVKLKPVQLLGYDGPADPGTLQNPSGYDTSITKLRIFEIDEYDRVLYFDSDSILQQHMDELFFLPSTPVAMPRVYWQEESRDRLRLSSSLMLVEPDVAETKHLWETLQHWRFLPDRAPSDHYDTDLFNDRFGGSALVLPHRPYILQSSEFRWHDHERYLGSHNAPSSFKPWDAHAILKEAKLIHFNDWPLPKPWIMWPVAGLAEIQPDCEGSHAGTCPEREAWKSLYDDFRRRRKDVCRILSVPAPQSWEEFKNLSGAR